MERVEKIMSNRHFQEYVREIEKCEEGRIFCLHNMSHFLDVARIGMIINYEEELNYPKDIIYAAALLHDCGKHEQYRNGTPHELASARLAPEILRECGYKEEEIGLIVDAIASHRDSSVKTEASLRSLLYRADKMSRPCYDCKAASQCNWDENKKNHQVKY